MHLSHTNDQPPSLKLAVSTGGLKRPLRQTSSSGTNAVRERQREQSRTYLENRGVLAVRTGLGVLRDQEDQRRS